MKNCKYLFACIAAVLMICTVLMSAALAEGVVVHNFKELLDAVNNQRQAVVLIAANYRHNSTEIENLVLHESQVLDILPENGESATINGRIDIAGPGFVTFEGVNIQGQSGSIGLWIGEQADVTVHGTVSGGKGSVHGVPAVFVDEGSLTIDAAIGSDGGKGIGGDGIMVTHGTVTVQEAIGGNAKQGLGGCGVRAFGNCRVTVKGSATGGNGLINPGKGVLLGLDSTLTSEGQITDGTKIETRNPPNTEIVTSVALLENALREGRDNITISGKFQTEGFPCADWIFFTPQTELVRISAEEGKSATFKFPWNCTCGNWELNRINIENSMKYTHAVLASHASISMTGNIKVSGQAGVACVIAGDNGTIRITGDISSSAKDSAMLQTVDGGFLTVTGKVTASADENAILCRGGRIELNGDIIQKGATVNIPTVSVSGGETVIRGSVIHNVQNKDQLNNNCLICNMWYNTPRVKF